MNVDGLEARLRERTRDAMEIEGMRRAAVLVPILEREGQTRLLFTQRSAALRSHSGQISFPGGRVEEHDETPAASALREAEEEIGLDPSCATVLGLLDDVPTPTGYVITPVVATLRPAPASYRANPAEVAEIFEVPLSRFGEPGVLEVMGEVERWERRFKVMAYHVDGRKIWGATARMVSDLLDCLRG
jgi:8-oxo-dGTP pyrophosphatase MutT (NUDIX family)